MTFFFIFEVQWGSRPQINLFGGAMPNKEKELNAQARLKSDSQLPKNFVLFASLKTLKNDEKCFLFGLNSSFCSQDI